MRAIIVSGDRYATKEDWGSILLASISHCRVVGSRLTIIHGSCDGIDNIVDNMFKYEPDYMILPMPAQWHKLGKGAGMARNNKMIQVLHALKDTGYETSVLAYHPNIENSKGTRGMINIAINGRHETWFHDLSGIPVKITEQIK